MRDSALHRGRHNAKKIARLERNLRRTIFYCVLKNFLSFEIQKLFVFVEMTRSFLFGKCFG